MFPPNFRFNLGTASTVVSRPRNTRRLVRRVPLQLEKIPTPPPLTGSSSETSPLRERNVKEYHPLDESREHVNNGEWEKGLKALKPITSLSPLFIESFLLQAECQVSLHRYEEALVSLATCRYSLTRPQDEDKIRELSYKAYLGRSDHPVNKENPQQILYNLTEAYKIFPNPVLALRIGSLLEQSQNYLTTLAFYKKALILFPHHPDLLARV